MLGATVSMVEEKGCKLPKVVRKMNVALGFPKCSTFLYNIDKILPNSEAIQENTEDIEFYHPNTTQTPTTTQNGRKYRNSSNRTVFGTVQDSMPKKSNGMQ